MKSSSIWSRTLFPAMSKGSLMIQVRTRVCMVGVHTAKWPQPLHAETIVVRWGQGWDGRKMCFSIALWCLLCIVGHAPTKTHHHAHASAVFSEHGKYPFLLSSKTQHAKQRLHYKAQSNTVSFKKKLPIPPLYLCYIWINYISSISLHFKSSGRTIWMQKTARSGLANHRTHTLRLSAQTRQVVSSK